MAGQEILDETFCCPICGGTNVQIRAWIDPNTNQYCSDVSDPLNQEDTWCLDCDNHTGLITAEEFRKKKKKKEK